ncbi:DNRLRE domain-containing protein [Streptomyces sp. SCSIO 30461]|uniref:DNRLRE domain-containing protein n=1 Tax=Streptomyces sp. SCSIO 30461 TaxID=3118085 RepID=UPI0030D11DA8
MSQRRYRLPGRRTIAIACAAAVAATGLTYAGFEYARSGADAELPARTSEVSESEAIDRAARSGEAVEATALRTPYATTWARPDGLMTRTIHVSPVRAKVGGQWKPIDRSLHRTSRGWEPKATNTSIVFSTGTHEGDGGRAQKAGAERATRTNARRIPLLKNTTVEEEPTANPLVTLQSDGHDIQLTWPGPIPEPIISANQALYPEIIPGADLVLTADDDGFGQLLVVKDRTAAADPRVGQLSYGLTSPTLTFRLDPQSGIVSAENPDGDEVALSPTPLMWDSAGAPAVTDGEVGASAQPTEPEVLPSETTTPSESATPSETPSPSADADDTSGSDEQTDPYEEVLPSASDEPAPPVSESPLPTAPDDPAPEPSQTGAAATLSLPGIEGPSPDSHGALVDADLSGANWVLTPDADLLTDPATVFPVFIDPSVKKHTQNWTTAYNRHPKATFYNGKGFNRNGTHEARVGFESDTWGTSRSFFNLDFDESLQGVIFTDARLRVFETYSWSCNDRALSVHLTGEITSRTNWSNAPKLYDGNKIDTESFAHGYKSGCRKAYETFEVKKAAQKIADRGLDSITFGMRAVNEKSQYSWKKFRANGEDAPVLVLDYNRRPEAPTELDLGPDAKCTTSEPYVRMGAGDITFTASAKDKDKNLDYFDFDLWQVGKLSTTGDLLKSTGKVSVGSDTYSARRTTPRFSTDSLTNGAVYSWRVRAVDDAGASSGFAPAKTPCRFVFDTQAPKPPKVSSSDFPNADGSENGFGSDAEDAIWSAKKFGSSGTFTVRALSSDVVRYEYGFNSAYYTGSVSRTAGTATSVSAAISNAKPPTAGPNVLYVRAVDQAGNVSEPTKYFFYITPRDQADTPGDFTGDKLPDLLTVTKDGNLRLYPSQAKSDDLTKGTGDLDYSMSAAYRDNPAKDPNGDDRPVYVAAPSGHFDDALITHNGDIYGADGLQDLVVRVEGKLWVYPGDGYGAVNIDRRREILLPDDAPAPASLTQIVSAGDATGDGKADFFATVDDDLWVLTGYNGATISTVTRLASSGWDTRDIVTAQDITGDGVTDLVFRSDGTSKLYLREGIAGDHGVELGSLAYAADSAGGADTTYGSAGWHSDSIPFLIGTPDANGDSIPDIWTVRSDGSVRFYAGGRTVLSGSGTEYIGASSWWKTRQAIG